MYHYVFIVLYTQIISQRGAGAYARDDFIDAPPPILMLRVSYELSTKSPNGAPSKRSNINLINNNLKTNI